MTTEFERQEHIVASIGRLADTVSDLRDTQLELIKWLQQPASSDLSDLFKMLIVKADDLAERQVKTGAQNVEIIRLCREMLAKV